MVRVRSIVCPGLRQKMVAGQQADKAIQTTTLLSKNEFFEHLGLFGFCHWLESYFRSEV